jgi:gluconolactonase
MFMISKGMLLTAAGCLAAIAILGQTPAAPQTGPGVQALQDAKFPEFVAAKCKTPPPQRGGGAGRGAGSGSAAGRGSAAAGPPEHRTYEVKAIPGVIAAGQQWKTIWTGTGNNADGIVATKDGAIMAAQNTNSSIMKLDKDGKVSIAYMDTRTSGAVSMNKKGALFVVERMLPQAIWELAPKKQLLADSYNGEPFECTGGLLNDLTADSKGGVYFTMGGLFYASPRGEVTKQGTITGTNGLILSRDEKTLYVTGRIGNVPAPAPGGAGGAGGERGGGRGPAAPGTGGSLIAYDVQPDGSLKNERQFAMVGGDGTTIDSEGRLYSTQPGGTSGIQVVAPDGKFLGEIPTPLPIITAAFSGPDKKTLFAVANTQRFDEIFTIQMIAQGYKGRAK